LSRIIADTAVATAFVGGMFVVGLWDIYSKPGDIYAV
jgi:hypothetical protein